MIKRRLELLYKTLTIKIVALAAAIACCGADASAFDASVYAGESVLSSGRWVKVKVTGTGLHLITTADLRRWGFNDPSAVSVYGYGGAGLSDVLTQTGYVDDLPRLQSVTTPRGIVFYADGPEGWRVPPRQAASTVRREHVVNPYSTVSYYYLTDSATAPRTIEKEGRGEGGPSPATSFNERLYHELDQVTIKETGHDLYGEDFRFTSSRTFNFTLTDRVEDTDVWMQCRMFADSPSGTTTVSYTANGTALATSSLDRIPAVPASASYTYGDTCLTQKTFGMSGQRLALGVAVRNTGSLRSAYLDRIDINYTRALKLPPAGTLAFSSPQQSLSLDVAGASGVVVWDVTDPLNIVAMNAATAANGRLEWTGEYSGTREYVAWREGATLPSPEFVGNVSNQNLHAIDGVDMVIITLASLRGQAERIAELHRQSADSLKVAVIDADAVYNEFSSGSPEHGAFRRLLKMLWDRSSTADRPLRYCMLVGRPTYDHRRMTAAWRNSRVETLPVWQTRTSINDNYSYSSDDVLAMLEDGSGAGNSAERLCIALGRLPVSTISEARTYVDKLETYMTSMPTGDWVNHILVVADDQDNGQHLEQTESMLSQMQRTDNGNELMVDKVYLDAYAKSDNRVPLARDKMYRKLDEGVMWWNYVGHAGHAAWTHENQLTTGDINNLYYRRLPVLYAATCDFGRWDSEETCGAEMMLLKEGGGVIAAVTATRPVYISQNGTLTRSLGATLMRLDENGRQMTLGEVVRRAKNGHYMTNKLTDTNRFRYVLFGDPALPLAFPSMRVKVDRINGVEPDGEADVAIMAHQHAVIEGHVENADGTVAGTFEGSAIVNIYDAEFSTTTLGRGTSDNPGKEVNFEQQGELIFSGRVPVKEGRFSITAAMPSEVAQNYRPAAVSVVAEGSDGRRASGINRNFFVYGYDEGAPVDTIAPRVDYAYLNHSSFVNGDVVNESPMLIASVSDNVGINLSTSGIGHQMFVQLDGSTSYTNVTRYYEPSADGSPSGTIVFPLEGLEEGPHTMTLRVWDTSNNAGTATIDFHVMPGLAPKIFNVYTDTNPATTEARFYLEYNRPDASLTVTVEVYNLMGRLEWTSTSTGRSDMFTSAPIVWNLNNNAGQRVVRGIYIYRVTVSTDGVSETSASGRIAVTGR